MSRSRHVSGFCRAICLGAVLVLATCVGAPGPQPTVPMDLSDAWHALWSDRFSEAENSFRDALKVTPSSAEAARGLGLALFARGAVFEAADSMMDSIAMEKDETMQFVVRQFLADSIPHRDAMDSRLQGIDKMFEGSSRPLWIRRAGLRFDLRRAMDVTGDAAAAARLAEDMGAVKGWRLAGPFLSVSGSGFNTPFIDEKDFRTSLSNDPPTRDKGNLPVRWIVPSDASPEGVVDLSSRYNSSGSAVYYAAATTSVPADGDYWIILDRCGAVRMWVDNAVKLDDPTDRSGAEMHWLRTSLRKGDHKVVIKIAEDMRPASFRVFLQSAVEPAATEAAVRGYLSDFHLGVPESSPFIARLSLRAQQSGRVEDFFWLAISLSGSGYAEAGLDQIARARKLIPGGDFSFSRIVESHCAALLGRTDEARNALAGPSGAKPFFAPTSDFLLGEALSDGRTSDVERLLADSEGVFGKRYGADLYAALFAAYTGKDVSARLAAFRKEYSDVPQLTLTLLSGSWAGISSNRVLSDAISEKLPPSSLYTLARGLFGLEEWAPAASLAARFAALQPESDSAQILALMTEFRMGTKSPESVLDRLDELTRQFPRSRAVRDLAVSLCGAHVETLEADTVAGKGGGQYLESAQQRLATVIAARIELQPGDFGSRERLRGLKKEKSLSSLVALSDPIAVIAEYRKAPQSTGDVVRLLDECTEMYFLDGGRHMVRQIVYGILSRSGAKLVSSQDLRFDPSRDDCTISSAFVLAADGTRITARTADGKVSFPGIGPGDFTVLSYVVDGADSGYFTGQFWTSTALNSRFPAFRTRWSLIYPSSLVPKVAYHNAQGVKYTETRTSPAPEFSEISIGLDNVEALQTSAAPPDWQDALAWVDVSTIGDWQRIVEWYTALSSGRCLPTSGIVARVRALTDPKAGRDKVIAALYDYVSNKVNYEDLSFQYSAYVPQRPETVMRDGYGDCKDKSALLVSMLSAAGIEASLALSEPSYAGTNTYLPSPRFSHAIVDIPGAGPHGADLLLDPTSAYFTYPEIPPVLVGTWYLPIPKAGSSALATLLRVGKSEAAGTGIMIELKAKAGDWHVQGDAVFRGIYAAQVRAILDSGSPDIQRMAFALYIAQGLPGFKLEQFDAANVEQILTSPVVSFSGNLPEATIKGGPVNLLSLPWFVVVPAGLLDEVRTAPKDSTVVIDVPELQSPLRQTFAIDLVGYGVPTLPPSARVAFRDAYAEFKYSMSGGTLIAERELFLPRMSVDAADLPALDTFLAVAATHQLETVTLVPPGKGMK